MLWVRSYLSSPERRHPELGKDLAWSRYPSYALSAVILDRSKLSLSDLLAWGEQCRSYTRFAMLSTLSKPAFWGRIALANSRTN
jgi:hypothetical protein